VNNFAVIDAARLKQKLGVAQRLHKQNVSLYRGRPEEALSGVAPYLFSIERNSNLDNLLAHNGIGNSWGIYITSRIDFDNLRKHLRRFLMVQMEDTGEQLYFRFYDPRVLRIFLPTCNLQQLKELFGQAITHFICEDEDSEFVLRFSLRNGELHTERVAAISIFPVLKDAPIIFEEPTFEDENVTEDNQPESATAIAESRKLEDEEKANNVTGVKVDSTKNISTKRVSRFKFID